MLSSFIRQALCIAARADSQREKNTDDVLAEYQQYRADRRQFLKTSLQASALIGIGGPTQLDWPSLSSLGLQPKVAIVGAGIGGLSTAWHLRRRGIVATVFEADKRVAGRIKSARLFGDGALNTELGAEFIDSNHRDLFRLIRAVGLRTQMMDLEDDTFGIKEAFFIDNKRYGLRDVVESVRPTVATMRRDQNTWGTPMAKDFDGRSIAEYLENLHLEPWVKKLFSVAFVSENGLEAEEQSAWNFLSYLSLAKDKFKLYGDSDERYKIIGGNEQLPRRLADSLESQIRMEHRLEALKEQQDGRIRLVFSHHGSTVEDTFDAVVMTLPFTVLRELDLQIEMSPLKQRVIKELRYGANVKFLMETRSRIWRTHGYQGLMFGEHALNGWDSSQMQQGNQGTGVYACLLGGKQGMAATKGTEYVQMNKVMPDLEAMFPGMRADLTERMELAHWPSNPFSKGGYTAFGVGQHVAFQGMAAEPVRRLYFAGEHCSPVFWGFMNGAAETGRKAAEAIAKHK